MKMSTSKYTLAICVLIVSFIAGAESFYVTARVADQHIYRFNLNVADSEPIEKIVLPRGPKEVATMALRPGTGELYVFKLGNIYIVSPDSTDVRHIEKYDVKYFRNFSMFSPDGRYLYVTGTLESMTGTQGLVLDAQTCEIVRHIGDRWTSTRYAQFSTDSDQLLFHRQRSIMSLSLGSGEISELVSFETSLPDYWCRGFMVQASQRYAFVYDSESKPNKTAFIKMELDGSKILAEATGSQFFNNQPGKDLFFYGKDTETVTVLNAQDYSPTKFRASFRDRLKEFDKNKGRAGSSVASSATTDLPFGLNENRDLRFSKAYISPSQRFAIFCYGVGWGDPGILCIRSMETGEWSDPIHIGEHVGEGGLSNIVFLEK